MLRVACYGLKLGDYSDYIAKYNYGLRVKNEIHYIKEELKTIKPFSNELRQQIRAAAWDQAQVTDASLFIVMCADLKSWEKQPQRYWADADQPIQDFILPAIDQYYRGKSQVQRDEAMRSCGIATQTLMLAAKAMGYDSCPMDGFDFEKVGQLINLPDDHVIALCIAIGKATQAANPRGGQLDKKDVLIQNRFA